MIKKICFSCYSNLFPGKAIRKVTLGRQCVLSKKSTDQVEQMIPVETEDIQKGECNSKCSRAFQ